MELAAAIEGLKRLKESCQVEIITDSEYLRSGITSWVAGWKRNGWRTAAKKPVLNQDLWMQLVVVSSELEIEWKYVAGHSGEEYNERCDEIATSFADDLNITLYNGARSGYKLGE